MNKLFILLGRAASGKDSVMESLLPKLSPLNINKLPSNTTRPKREGEVEGREYHFSTLHEFDTLYQHNKIAEYAIYNTKQGFWCYYTKQTDLELLNDTSLIAIKNPLGYRQLASGKYKKNIVTILLDCPEYILKERYLKRGALDDSLEDRIERDRKDFMYLIPNYTILNDGSKSIEEVTNQIIEIIKGEIK